MINMNDFFIENENKIIRELSKSKVQNQLNLSYKVIEKADLIAIYIVDITKFIIIKNRYSKCPYIVGKSGFGHLLSKSSYPIIEETTFLENKKPIYLTDDLKVYRI